MNRQDMIVMGVGFIFGLMMAGLIVFTYGNGHFKIEISNRELGTEKIRASEKCPWCSAKLENDIHPQTKCQFSGANMKVTRN